MVNTPSANDFNAHRVTNRNQSEVIRQRFYDYQLYPTAGQSQLSFFAQPVGSGKTSAQGATAGTGKTLHDTNLEIGNTLPSGKQFFMESIEVVFMPGSVSTTDTYTPANLSLFAAVNAAAVMAQINDVNTFYQSGLLELEVSSKVYLRETPLSAFPPKTFFELSGSVGTNSATTGEIAAISARASGRNYYIDPEITLEPAVNFSVNLKWPAAVAMPSGFNARVGVILDGFFMRASQ
jgi:hypothetical protein